MLKAFVYPDAELIKVAGFTQEQIDKARTRQTPEFEPTTDPLSADFFWLSFDMGHWEAYRGGVAAIKAGMPKLSHWAGNERRHAAFFCSDGAEPVGLPFIMFRNSYNKNRPDENVVAWPYGVDDLEDLTGMDFDTLPYDVSIVANISGVKVRRESCASIQATPSIKSFIDDTHLNWGTVENTEYGRQRKAIYIKSMLESRMILAPRGGGLSSARFFEAMSAGRVAIMLSDDWEFPFKDLIHWDWAIVQIPEKDAKQAGAILADYIKRTPIRKLAEMGAYARGVWQSYLAPAVWGEMMTWYIEKLLR